MHGALPNGTQRGSNPQRSRGNGMDVGWWDEKRIQARLSVLRARRGGVKEKDAPTVSDFGGRCEDPGELAKMGGASPREVGSPLVVGQAHSWRVAPRDPA